MCARRHRLLAAALGWTLLVAALPDLAGAATALERRFVSSDVSLALGSVTLEPGRVAEDGAPVTLVDLGALPPGARIAGFDGGASGERLLAFDQATSLPGVSAEGRDVIAYDGATYRLEFDGEARGVPAGAHIDAVARVGGDLLLSFDVTASIGGVLADDEDLVQVGAASASLFFDGSAAGVPAGLDLDAADRLANGHLLLSFDGSGRLGGVDFDDEDVLEYDPGGGSWEMAYDGSTRASGWVGADLDAFAADEVPTPTPTEAPTETPTDAPTATHTSVATATGAVPTSTSPPTSTPTEVFTATPVDTPSPTRVPSSTATETAVETRTFTPTPAQDTATPTETEATASATPTPPTSSPTPIAEASRTPTATATPSASPTPTGTAAPTATLPAGTYFAGDANCDALVTSADLPALATLLAVDMQACGSDADCDGDIDAADVDAVIAIVYAGAPLAPCAD